MKKTVWIVASVAVFALACSDNNAAKTVQQSGADNPATAQGNLTVAGCLARADEMPGSVGAAGSGSPSATNPSTSGTSASTPSSATERFVLRQAQPAGGAHNRGSPAVREAPGRRSRPVGRRQGRAARQPGQSHAGRGRGAAPVPRLVRAGNAPRQPPGAAPRHAPRLPGKRWRLVEIEPTSPWVG